MKYLMKSQKVYFITIFPKGVCGGKRNQKDEICTLVRECTRLFDVELLTSKSIPNTLSDLCFAMFLLLFMCSVVPLCLGFKLKCFVLP
jgi:hypothetical protein